MNTLVLRKILILSIILFLIIDIYIFIKHIEIPLFCSKNTVLNIVAHEDDDLLFLSPDLIHNINSGKCVRTIFITAGDNGYDSSYWLSRENGSKAAYASMSNTDNIWIKKQIIIEKNKIMLYELKNNPKISLIFMRLPDGGLEGQGFSKNNYQSIAKLWQSKIISIKSLDGSGTYTKDILIDTVLELIKINNPIEIKTQDFVGIFGDGDHSDHYAASYFVHKAENKYLKSHKITSYIDYSILSKPQNVFGEDEIKKRVIFFLYLKYDNKIKFNNDYQSWLKRQYQINK